MGRPRTLTDEERRERKNAITKAWGIKNRERRAATNKARRQANREQFAASRKAYNEADKERRAAQNRERKAAYNKAWDEANPGYYKAYREANQERAKARSKAWHEANPEHVKTYREANRERRTAYQNARRARFLGAFVELVDPTVVFDRDGGVCGICDSWVLADEKWHIDHIHPLSKGGEHSYANCQLAHAHCNLSKHNKIPTTTKGHNK